MMLAALLAALQTAPAPPPPEDVVVTARRAQRLKRLNMVTALDRKTGATRCVFKRRSGDSALDTAVCDAALACVPWVETVEQMRRCLAPTLDALVAGAARWEAREARR